MICLPGPLERVLGQHHRKGEARAFQAFLVGIAFYLLRTTIDNPLRAFRWNWL